ncbi:hypothetical protein Plhal304r1_c044g0124291 [Plasmopara halstedii]
MHVSQIHVALRTIRGFAEVKYFPWCRPLICRAAFLSILGPCRYKLTRFWVAGVMS